MFSDVFDAVCKSDGGGWDSWLTFDLRPHAGATSLPVSASPPPYAKVRLAAGHRG